ncbi:MAG: ATP-dependent Clp protease ATP-binding subunit ClpX [bacterium]|jgi:ATP-dependent Clp protease ATP-binding subunit ClpX|nr:ATP-dependent Clp protease ATP-binding subunit ClpX [bacterium]
MPKNNKICHFCGRPENETGMLIHGIFEDTYICDSCIQTAAEILQLNEKEKEREQAQEFHLKKLPVPSKIHKELNRYVIGQENAKRMVSVAVYNHYKRINNHLSNPDIEIDKSNILMLGPTGTGKTLIAQTLARQLQVPFAIADATVLTEAGYVGEDVENILVRLLQAADYDEKKAEYGIVYLDELDKIARKSANPSITRDVSGEGVQQSLLKILEGTIAHVPPKGGRKHPEAKMVHIDTRNILFICGGAFDGIEDVIARRIGKKEIGFGEKQQSGKTLDKNALLAEISPEDLIQYGFIPELVGRLAVLTSLNELDESAMISILTEPKNALIKQYQFLLRQEGMELELTEDALQAIIQLAMKRKTGARALRAVMENVMLDLMYRAPDMKNVVKVTIDADVVNGKKDYILKKQEAPPSPRPIGATADRRKIGSQKSVDGIQKIGS